MIFNLFSYICILISQNCAIMKIINSELSEKIIEQHSIKLGQFYFLKDLMVAEINNGEHIDFESSQNYLKLINEFYGTEKPFGYICNRVNYFSISPLDFPKFIKVMPNLSIFGIVHNNHFDRMNYEVEKRFCNKPYKSFIDLNLAYKKIKRFIENLKFNIEPELSDILM